jgi:prepilin-type N-terminal cleavage/methylation domain-containing protein
MSIKNIKSNTQAQKGFTIVELLIVVVVIAILAAITIVSYNGITSRANASSAQATASSLQKKIELYAADGPTGQYPKTITTDLMTAATSKSFYIASGSMNAPVATDPTSGTGKNSVRYQPCGAGATAAAMTSVAGAKITWFDFTKAAGAELTVISVGDSSTGCVTS